jgi:alkaline phosphatase
MPKRVISRSKMLILVLIFATAGWAGQSPKNVILLIGDGMGVGHVTLARLAVQAETKTLNIDSIRTAGLVKTHSANSVVTDSAGAGTALATGWKTNNGMISTLPDGTAVLSILEAAQGLQKSSGLVTTVTITDATPAVFAAHEAARADQDQIAGQLLAHRVNVLFGGGREYFIPKTQTGSKRKDESDLLAQAKQAGYAVMQTREELMAQAKGNMLGLFALDEMTTEAPEPTLKELTDDAIRRLSGNKHGFFLMVEGGEIDHKAHSNDAPGVIKQVRDFDAAVGTALAYARTHKDTLIIVTADHETGGLAVMPPASADNSGWAVAWTTKGHSGNSVGLWAEGPGSSEFGGVMDNTDVPKRIAKLWKVRSFPEKRSVQK